MGRPQANRGDHERKDKEEEERAVEVLEPERPGLDVEEFAHRAADAAEGDHRHEGGQQRWWLQDVLSRLDETTLFYGAAALTAITDNALLTYLGSLVEGVTEDYKYALVAGAVAGGGLTVIANAPNPAGFAILKDSFEDQSINPLGLLLAALAPTLVAVISFRGIRGPVGEFFDVEAWALWYQHLDRSFLFLLILPFVVAAVGLWAGHRDREK